MPIKLKNSQVTGRIPVANDLAIGEVALNTADGKLYTKHSDESIKLISPSKTDLDLNNVDNTSDVNKPVSTATTAAIAVAAAQADAGLAFERWGRELSESALIASVDSTQPLKTKKTQNTSYGTYDGFLANLSEGSLQSYPIGGGGNLSDIMESQQVQHRRFNIPRSWWCSWHTGCLGVNRLDDHRQTILRQRRHRLVNA
jgi:hypothetical protein